MVMVNRNGNVLYCRSCSYIQKNFRKVILFIENDFNKLHTDKKMEMFNLMIKLDPNIVWRKILT